MKLWMFISHIRGNSVLCLGFFFDGELIVDLAVILPFPKPRLTLKGCCSIVLKKFSCISRSKRKNPTAEYFANKKSYFFRKLLFNDSCALLKVMKDKSVDRKMGIERGIFINFISFLGIFDYSSVFGFHSFVDKVEQYTQSRLLIMPQIKEPDATIN